MELHTLAGFFFDHFQYFLLHFPRVGYIGTVHTTATHFNVVKVKQRNLGVFFGFVQGVNPALENLIWPNQRGYFCTHVAAVVLTRNSGAYRRHNVFIWQGIGKLGQ